MIRRCVCALAVAILSCPAPCKAYDEGLPTPVIPGGLGVNIHFTDPQPGEMARFAEAGYRFIRNDLAWQGIERKPGVYDFSACDRLMSHLKAAGARAIFILDYGNRLYDGGQAPRSDAARAAYARFAAAAATHYRGQGVIWEIWNEPNLGQFWKPDPDPAVYARLALEASRAIRAADPSATIIAPGSSEFPWEFLETTFAAGLLEQIDAVSVHPYRQGAPESALKDYGRLRALIARHASPSRRSLPIVSSEWGYTTATGALSEAEQAHFLARQWLANLAAGVNLSIFYDWRDDGDDPTDREARFGTVRRNFEPKPSFQAARELIHSLHGFTFRHRLRGVSAGDWRLLFQNGDDPAALILVEWSADAHGASARTPRYRPVDPQSPEAASLRPLASVRWAPGPLAEQQDAAAELRVTVVNPFPDPARVRLDAGRASGPSVAGLELTAPPRGQASGSLVLPVPSLRREFRSVDVEVRRNDRRLPTVVPLDVWRADPLRLSPAPRGRELEVTVENPSHRPVSGPLVLKARGRPTTSRPVRIEPGAREARVRFPLPDGPYEVALGDGRGHIVAVAGPARYEAMPGFSARAFEAILFVDNAARTPRTLEFQRSAGVDPPAPVALQVDYQFEPGWRDLAVAPRSPMAVPDGAAAAILWMRGNTSGDALRCRIQDASGQTFQPDLGTLNQAVWWPVRIDLAGLAAAAHWGGRGDGVPHPPLTWEALVLIDSSRHGHLVPRSIQVAAPCYVFDR
jgi:hypothetical protein